MFKYILLFLFSSAAWAHPVSFKDSKGVMGHHSPSSSHVQLNYSFQYWWALGIHHFRYNDESTKNLHATVASSNFLLKRWNGPASQANLYALLGAGNSELSGEPEGIQFAGAQFDIEDRRYYFLAKTSQLFNNEQTDLRQSHLRLGIAPYVGAYEDLHSWLILEWAKMEYIDQPVTEETTPFLRFFYKNLLFEIGQSFSGATKFNYIVHF